jgi:hypothetical protein
MGLFYDEGDDTPTKIATSSAAFSGFACLSQWRGWRSFRCGTTEGARRTLSSRRKEKFPGRQRSPSALFSSQQWGGLGHIADKRLRIATNAVKLPELVGKARRSSQ